MNVPHSRPAARPGRPAAHPLLRQGRPLRRRRARLDAAGCGRSGRRRGRHHGTQGPQRDSGAVVGLSENHQGRCHGGQGHRAEGQVPEHRRQAGAGRGLITPTTRRATAPPRPPCWRAPSPRRASRRSARAPTPPRSAKA
ncbi:hypothetical protein FJT64_021397 [Amphibalanus amphitrite]|uniref:Uncharacterized protein n=1 Tax=Amphibalanus amphitrite TaxID=1232801 RepID=A0A6A4WXN9_AMPAM|nr:hypothetical protein FJT64_021397 [Amphibalanus amphitrite]